MNDIFNDAVNNSIGKEKKVKKEFKKKFFVKLPMTLITGVLIAVSAAGCGLINIKETSKDTNPIYEEYMNIAEDYGVTSLEINTYQINRLYELLDKYGIDKYEVNGIKREYFLTADDYEKISELDESYLCAMYYSSSKSSANEMAKALGYAGIDDYLIKNDFKDKDGKADFRLWSAANSVNFAKEISKDNKGGTVK